MKNTDISVLYVENLVNLAFLVIGKTKIEVLVIYKLKLLEKL